MQLTVETSSGRVRGTNAAGVHIFRGLPYAADTGGAARFQPPRPLRWAGVRDTIAFGPRCPQNESATRAPWLSWLRDARVAGEDCLVLNIFTGSLHETARRPVMVYLHGGGFSSSSSGTPGVDGSNLARRGAVVVTLNHRLNLFGHLYLGDADGGRYADSGNAGVLDLVAALQWIQVNIGRFGGDPGSVTLFGQSGGGSKVAVLMAAPAARGLFHKAIIQSASSLLRVATREEAERNTHFFLQQLGLDRSRLKPLHELPAHKLLEAMPAAVRAAGSIDDFRPVVDGRTLLAQPFSPAALSLSAHVPLMTGWCENEQRLTFANQPEIYELPLPEAVKRTGVALGISEEAAARLLRAYQAGRPQDSPGDLYAQVFGDYRYRRNVTRAAELRVAHGGAPTYLYLLDWKTPVHGGLLRSPHTLCIAFAFANVDLAAGMTGRGEDRYEVQEQMAGAWLAFARTARPVHEGLRNWPAFELASRPTLVFNRSSQVANDPLAAERVALGTHPPYVPSVGEGRLR